MKTKPIGHKPVTERSVPHNGFIVGSGQKTGKFNRKAATHHDGIVVGGSVTTKKETPSAASINRLPSKRSDGRIL